MQINKAKFTLGLAVLFTGCVSAGDVAQGYSTSKQAIDLAQNAIIVDGHIDVPYRLHEGWVDVTGATDAGDFDYPRAKAGGLNAPFMSIYVPSKLDGTEESTQRAHQLIDYVEAIVGRAPDKYAIARSPDDVEAQFKQGLISLPLGLENGAPINDDLDNLRALHQRGIRYVTLTHAKSNNISDSSYDEKRPWGGLSPFGEEVVAEMNKLGVMVDIAHVSDEAFYDAIKISRAPMIASHSSMRHFTPGFERNMSDEMVTALADKGGIIMINYGSTFLDKKSRAWMDKRTEAAKPTKQKYGEYSDELADFKKAYLERNPMPFANLDKAIEHIDYAVKLVGIDHVGIGSDYDGVGDSLPVGLKDVSSYPNLVQGLLDRDYSEADIKKILGGNLLRVWREVEQIAEQS